CGHTPRYGARGCLPRCRSIHLPVVIASFCQHCSCPSFFLSTDTATAETSTLSLHDALPICGKSPISSFVQSAVKPVPTLAETRRSEEHTSELQSRFDLVCRLLLEKKKKNKPRVEKAMRERPNHSKRTGHWLHLDTSVQPDEW